MGRASPVVLRWPFPPVTPRGKTGVFIGHALPVSAFFFPEGPPEDMRRQAHRLNCCPQPAPTLYANRPPSSPREWLALCFFSLSQIVYILDYFSSIVFPWWTQAGLFFGRIASDVLCWRGSTWFGKFLWADQLLSNLGAVSIIKCRAET